MFQPPYGKPWLLYGLLGGSLALNILMVLDKDDSPVSPSQSVSSADVVSADVLPDVAPDGSTTSTESTPEPASALTDAGPVTQGAPAPGEWRVVEARVKHSLARTFQEAVSGDHADALSAVYARLFMWDLDMRRDLQQGDKVRVAWRLNEEGKVDVLAASFRSRKFSKTLTAYRWTMPGDNFPSYWRGDGTEASFRLTNGPLRDYEQITSLLKDRPTHEGMDFKTPVGTPTYAPQAGTVTRVNWNWEGNGNCVEVKFADGVVAKFLHLSELKVSAGAHVQPGQVLALTGNTGRSTAPHLHYQVERSGRVLDPVDYHGTDRRTINSAAMPSFLEEVDRLSTLLLGS
jgi:murein DD-endopeptidase MepM/ murein hydrolase activator NlpD